MHTEATHPLKTNHFYANKHVQGSHQRLSEKKAAKAVESAQPLRVAKGTDGGEKGVLRLLREGHFKGVADVRLRINFMDRLEAIARQEINNITEQNVGSILNAIKSVVATQLAPGVLSEDQATAVAGMLESFIAEASRSFDELKAAGTPLFNETADMLNAAFQEFVASLQTVLGQTAQESSDESGAALIESATNNGSPDAAALHEDPGSAPGASPETPYQEFFDELHTVFSAALSSFAQDIADYRVLPELSEPRGNGAAYDKFLAIYNEMTGTAPYAASSPETRQLDIII